MRESMKIWGLRGDNSLLQREVRIPQLEGAAQLAVEHFRPRLEQQMCASGCPLHLLLLVEAFVQQGIDPGLHKGRRNHLPRLPARAIIDEQVLVPLQGPLEFIDRKSTRLNSSHANISYAAFCLKKKVRPSSNVD